MKAIVYRRFGSPDVLELAEVDRPTAGADEVLLRIRATGLNRYDWHFMRGEPMLFRPAMGLGIRKPRRATILGSDMAGVVEEVGQNATRFRPETRSTGWSAREGVPSTPPSSRGGSLRSPPT